MDLIAESGARAELLEDDPLSFRERDRLAG